jgi:PAS domain S-box-containing protein
LISWGEEPSLLSVAHDITGRKQVERELERHRHHLEEKVAARTVELTLANQELTREVRERQRTEAALRESRANLQTLFDTMQDFIFVLDGRGRVVQTNLQAARRLGYTLEEMDGLPVLELHPPEERDHALEVLADIMAGRTETCHIPLVTKQGQTIPVETKVAHGYWGDQAVIFGISRDITERRRAEESLTQLTGGVAHNFNNLLAAVLGNAQAARTELDKPGPNQANLRRLVDNVVRAADSGRGVVQRLAAYVGRRRRQEARPEALALSEAAEAALEIARAAYRHAGMAEVEVATRLDPELCVTAQRGELIEVFLNLIKNALEAMPGGGRLEMRSWREDGRACLSLADTGTGMDEETRRRVFQPFFSTKGVLGQGLGLASSRGIIRSLGGEITASSRPGRGTTITLSLPEAAPPAQAAEPAGPPGLAPGMEVLLVEDEGLVAAGLQSILEEAGFAVSLACRVDQACRALEDGLPDLVLCDLGLPDGSGWEVARRLAAVEKRAGRRAPLILVTGFAAEDGGERPEGAAPAYGVLYKPVDRTVLLDMIGEALAERREAAAS